MTITVLAATGVTIEWRNCPLRDGATVLGTATVVNGVATFDQPFTAGAMLPPCTRPARASSATLRRCHAHCNHAGRRSSCDHDDASPPAVAPRAGVASTVLVDAASGGPVNGGTVTLPTGRRDRDSRWRLRGQPSFLITLARRRTGDHPVFARVTPTTSAAPRLSEQVIAPARRGQLLRRARRV